MTPTSQQTAQRSGAALYRALTVLIGVTLGGGGLLVVGVVALWLRLAALLPDWTLTAPLSAAQGQQWSVILALLGGLSVLAVVVGSWFSAVLIGWVRAYLSGMRGWTQGEPIHLQRSEPLRLKLNSTITVTQWASALGVAVLLASGLAAGWLSATGLGTAALGQFLTGPDLRWALALLGSSVALSLGLAVGLGNLILAALRHWLNLTGARLRGESGAVQPATERVGIWLIFCLVVLAFDIASRLSLLPLLALVQHSFAVGLPASWLALLEGAVWPLLAAWLLGLIQSAALLWALLSLRQFALSAAQVMDSRPPSERR